MTFGGGPASAPRIEFRTLRGFRTSRDELRRGTRLRSTRLALKRASAQNEGMPASVAVIVAVVAAGAVVFWANQIRVLRRRRRNLRHWERDEPLEGVDDWS
jgi:hypothetical protein